MRRLARSPATLRRAAKSEPPTCQNLMELEVNSVLTGREEVGAVGEPEESAAFVIAKLEELGLVPAKVAA